MGLGRGHGFLAPAPWPLLGRTTTWPTRYDSAGVALTHTCHPPRSSILSLSVAYLHGRPGSRSAGGRAPSRSVPALGACLRSGLRVNGPRPACSFVRGRNRRAARRVGARRAFAHSAPRTVRRARRAALWSVLAPAVPRRGVESDSPVARRLWARPRGLKPRLPRPRRETRININITRRKTRETESETRYQCGTIQHERRNGSNARNGDMCTTSSDSNYSKCQVIEKITWS
jgi:hypothetical protein